MIQIRISLLVGTLLTVAVTANANIFVKDKREQKDPSDPNYPMLKSIGVVYTPVAQGYGTGWVIRDPQNSGCYVATNYHVAFMREKNPTTGEVRTVRATIGHELKFGIGANMAKPGDFADVVSAKVVEFGLYSRHDLDGRRNDWAIIKLDRCLGEKYGALSYARPTEDQHPLPRGPLLTAGYPGTRMHLPGIALEVGCRVHDDSPVFGLVSHDCALQDGASGSPVFEQNRRGTWEVVGMMSSGVNRSLDILPRYEVNRRNQMVYASAFFSAIDKIVGAVPAK